MRQSYILIATFFFMQTFVLHADKIQKQQGLSEILALFKVAWNSGKTEDFMKIFHPDNPMKKAYKSEIKSKDRINSQFAKMFDNFGKVTKTEIRKYIHRKNCFVVRVNYKKKGMIPGTFVVLKNKTGEWKIFDFNIDGQGEKELKE